jgi:hypothetical protein
MSLIEDQKAVKNESEARGKSGSQIVYQTFILNSHDPEPL